MELEKDLKCSFCLKGANEIKKLIAGPNNIFICNECVSICYEILNEDKKKEYSKEFLFKIKKKVVEMNKNIEVFIKELDKEIENKE